MIFDRVLRLRDSEVWDVTLDNTRYRVVAHDERRKSSREDYQNNLLFEDDIRENLVKVDIYSEMKVEKKHQILLVDFSKSITNHLALAHTAVIINFLQANLEESLREFLQMNYHLQDIHWKKYIHFNQD